MSFDSAKFKQGQGGRAKGVKNKLQLGVPDCTCWLL